MVYRKRKTSASHGSPSDLPPRLTNFSPAPHHERLEQAKDREATGD